MGERAPAVAGLERPAAEERRDRVAPLVPARIRRHADRRVRRQQLDDRVDVGRVPCAREALDQLALAGVAERAQRRLLAARGQPRVDGPVRALQRAVDRRPARPQRVRDLGAAEPEHVAQDQHRALARRQQLERGHERELDALALLVGLRRAGERLEPDRLGVRLGQPGMRIPRRALVLREDERAPPLGQPQRRVRRDPVEPRADRAAALEPRQPAPGAQQRVLQRVLGVLGRAEHPVAVRVELAPVRRDEPPVGVLVAGARRVEQLLLGHRPASQSASSPPASDAITLRRPRGGSSTVAPELARPLGRRADVRDGDVGQPHRRPDRAGGDPAPDPRADVQRQVRRDALGAPLQQLRVERAGTRGVAGVELEVHERAGAHPTHHASSGCRAGSAGAMLRAGRTSAATAPASASAAETPIAGPKPSTNACGVA